MRASSSKELCSCQVRCRNRCQARVPAHFRTIPSSATTARIASQQPARQRDSLQGIIGIWLAFR